MLRGFNEVKELVNTISQRRTYWIVTLLGFPGPAGDSFWIVIPSMVLRLHTSVIDLVFDTHESNVLRGRRAIWGDCSKGSAYRNDLNNVRGLSGQKNLILVTIPVFKEDCVKRESLSGRLSRQKKLYRRRPTKV